MSVSHCLFPTPFFTSLTRFIPLSWSVDIPFHPEPFMLMLSCFLIYFLFSSLPLSVPHSLPASLLPSLPTPLSPSLHLSLPPSLLPSISPYLPPSLLPSISPCLPPSFLSSLLTLPNVSYASSCSCHLISALFLFFFFL